MQFEKSIIRIFNKLISPLKRRIYLTVRRATITLINDSLKMQGLQLSGLAGETLDQVERVQEYGLSSHPHPNSEAVVLALAGNSAHSVVIAVDDRRYRLKGLSQGEVALYDDLGQKIHLKRNGIVADSPQNIYLKTDGVLRLEGEGVEIHGRSYIQQDVHGKGQRETCSGGTSYQIDTYQETHTVTSQEQGLSQPKAPSNHPEVS